MNSLRSVWFSAICSVTLMQSALAQVGPDSVSAPGKKPPLGDFDLDRPIDKHYGIQIIEQRKVQRDFREAPNIEKHWMGTYQFTSDCLEEPNSLTRNQSPRIYVKKMVITEEADKSLKILLWFVFDSKNNNSGSLDFPIETKARPVRF